MTISYNWLKDYIDLPESAEEVAQLLTSTGLEVENLEPFSTIKGNLEGLVVGEVLTCTKHPHADKLWLTTVDVGGDKILRIVCGARNVAAGQKVIVALPGATLHPFSGEPLTIQATLIRGEVSEGMICASDEIGLSDDHEGIMVLQTDLPNGTPASHLFQPYHDVRLHIGLTPNRSDAASHIGVARDLRARLNRKLRLPNVDVILHKSNNPYPVRVTVRDTKACIRYSGVTLSGVRVAESPPWLKNKLLAIGLSPINNIVDITNFVLHETGQPLHAFDADTISGRHIIVQTLPDGTSFTTLDGKERRLTANDLMICDEQGPLCMAGIFGGLRSGITPNTKTVFLESACFSPSYIRASSIHHGLKTDAAFRFERGTDPTRTLYALDRATHLMVEIAGAEIASEKTDVYPEPVPVRTITVKEKNVNRLIGAPIPRHEVFAILRNLDFEIIKEDAEHYVVCVPHYRIDVMQEADVVEEILRIYGFDRIGLKRHTSAEFISSFPQNSPDKFRKTLGDMLAAQGFYEISTNSLTRLAFQQKHHIHFPAEPVEILNKLSEEQGILRQTLLFTGLEVIAYNINRKQKDLKLFEFGKTYGRQQDTFSEDERLALYLTGLVEAENWQRPARNVSWYDLAQHIHNVLEKCCIHPVKQKEIHDARFDYAVELSTNHQLIGIAGKIKASILKDFGIRQEVFYAELDSGLLFRNANPMFVLKEVSRYPEVRRDLSLVLDKAVKFETIKELIYRTENRLIKDLLVFDVYEGDKIPEGKKAYALGFVLQDETKTLTDEEIDRVMKHLMETFERSLGAMIRK